MRRDSGVIQGFFAHGTTHLAARLGTAVQPQRGGAPPVPVQRHPAAFPLPGHLASLPQPGGQPLPPTVCQRMESFFGTSFSDVRVHISPRASAMGALAFTQGSHIHFAPGQYNPASPHGQQLLGHELAHVVQQRSGRVRNPFGSGVAVVHDPALEAEAERLGRQAAAAALQPRLAPAPRPPEPAAVQRFTIVGSNKIYNKEPAKRPWFGYPYVVAPRRTRFSGQQRQGADTGVNEFLQRGNRNQAYIRYAPLSTLSLRVSNDGNMAIENSNLTNRQPKAFFATQAVIAASNQALLGVNSIVRLQIQNEEIKILTGWRTQTTLYRVVPRFSANPSQNCDEIAGQITGIGGLVRAYASIGKQRTLEKFLRGDPSTFDADQEAASYVGWQPLRPERLRRLGANTAVAPGTGEAYATVTVGPAISHNNNKTQVRDFASNQVRNLKWGFHFGAVIAQSGGDRITLENYARGDNRTTGFDPRWFFQMYGESAGQTFHEFHEATGEFANPVTVRVRPGVPQPKDQGPLWYPGGEKLPSLI